MALSERVMDILRQRRGLESDDSSQDAYIKLMSADKKFDEFCEWHGLIGWGPVLRDVMAQCAVAGKEGK